MAGVGGGAYGVEAWMKQQGITGRSIRQEDQRRRDAGRYPGYSAWKELDSAFNREVAGPWQGIRAANEQAPPRPSVTNPNYSGPQYSLDDYMGASNDYMVAYRNNIAASRTQIEQQFALAFSDAETREGISQGVINQLPGQYDAIYAGASETIDREGKASLAVQEGHNLQSFEGAGEGAEGQKAAMTAGLASRKADVPLLAAGVTSQVNRQKGALGQAKFDRFGDLDRAAAEMEVNYTKEQGLAKRDWMMAQQARSWSLDDRNFAAQQDARLSSQAAADEERIWNRDRAGNREDQEWAMTQESRAAADALQDEKVLDYRQYSGGNSSIERAQAFREANPSEFNRIKDGIVARAEAQIGNRETGMGLFRTASHVTTWQDVYNKLRKNGNYRAAAIVKMRNS